MKTTALISIAAAVALALPGCATVTRGTQDTISVNSTPANADVALSSGQRGTTPATFKLPRNRAITVNVTKAGYEPQSVQVVPQIEGGGVNVLDLQPAEHAKFHVAIFFGMHFFLPSNSL